MNLNEWRPGQQPRSRLLDHSTAYPGGGASKKSLRSLAPFCPQLDRPSATTNKRSDRKHRGWLKTSMIAASPSLFRAWRFWAPSAHPREAESDSFLTCAAKIKQRLAAAGTRPCTLSLSSTIVVVSRVLREILRYSDRENIDNTYLVRNTWFLDRTQICTSKYDVFPPYRI